MCIFYIISHITLSKPKYIYIFSPKPYKNKMLHIDFFLRKSSMWTNILVHILSILLFISFSMLLLSYQFLLFLLLIGIEYLGQERKLI